MEDQEKSQADEKVEPAEIILAVGRLDQRALEKPSPRYPLLVEKAKLDGKAVVEVRVDKTGKVEQAVIISGHPVVHQAVLHAALQARFAPTFVQGQAVKLSGFLTYDLGTP